MNPPSVGYGQGSQRFGVILSGQTSAANSDQKPGLKLVVNIKATIRPANDHWGQG